MAEYIKRKDAIRCFKATMIQDAYPEPLKDRLAIAALSGAESIDIVHCKDCKYKYRDAECGQACELTELRVEDDDYCSYGEEQENE